MHFDDRLATVLRLPEGSDAFARIQFRQLVDILGRLPEDTSSETVDAAYDRLGVLARTLPLVDRARVLEEPMMRIAAPRLLEALATNEPRVATAAVRAASLTEAQWLHLIPSLPVQARGILRHRRDLDGNVAALLDRLGVADRGLPPALVDVETLQITATTSNVEILPTIAPSSVRAESGNGIGAIVRRIEEYRKTRAASPARPLDQGPEAPRLPLGDQVAKAPSPMAIDFVTDSEARITRADPHAAPALVGMRLASADDPASEATASGLLSALRHRQPLRGMPLNIDGAPAVAGSWRVDAMPRFDQTSGRFIGYAGRLRRPASGSPPEPASQVPSEADRMRQVLHELRTPANAIQVAAEIIQQQLYGPAPHEYRALAAAIASDVAHILAGFEEIDRLVKLECGALAISAGQSDISLILHETTVRLEAWTAARRSGFDLDQLASALPAAIAPDEAERLIWRLLAALAGNCAPDEVLPITGESDGTMVSLRIRLPQSLAATDTDLFAIARDARSASAPPAMNSGMFGVGFTLRLAAAEARTCGGDFQRIDSDLLIRVPGLTATAEANSQSR